MMKAVGIICIGCPLGCDVQLNVDESGDIISYSGYQCKVGKKYAEQEYRLPQRVMTTTIKTVGSVRRLLPARTDGPIPKDKITQCVHLLAQMEVQPPLKIGEVVIPNILDTGANVICTDDLLT